jgi:aerobic-type carbon monoxide dehydrogenase small subunit (CoxS/CutS family)
MMTLKVNGQVHQVESEPDTPLLYVLRDELNLNAAKFGCGLVNAGRAPSSSTATPCCPA